MRRREPFLALALLAVALAGVACGEGVPEPPAGARPVTIETPDGASLDAVELGHGDAVAILSHGATGTKEDFYALASALAEGGWRVIVYDARGVGESTGSGSARALDLRAVVADARDRGARRLVLVGGSLGASLSISMASELEADAVVALSPPAATFGALEAASELGGIALFVATAEDDQPFADDARSIAAAAGVSARIVDGDRHGTGMLIDHPELLAEIVRFAVAVASR